jgi:hypothetical protein
MTKEPFVNWPCRNRLDLVVQRDVRQRNLELIGGEESARAGRSDQHT